MAEADWEHLREDFTAHKRAAIDDLPALIERFTAEAEAVGAEGVSRAGRRGRAADRLRLLGTDG